MSENDRPNKRPRRRRTLNSYYLQFTGWLFDNPWGGLPLRIKNPVIKAAKYIGLASILVLLALFTFGAAALIVGWSNPNDLILTGLWLDAFGFLIIAVVWLADYSEVVRQMKMSIDDRGQPTDGSNQEYRDVMRRRTDVFMDPSRRWFGFGAAFILAGFGLQLLGNHLQS